MEALRAVDRYGVTRCGEQYQGFRALPSSTDPADAIVTVEQAVAVIHAHVSDLYAPDDVAGAFAAEAAKNALRRTHPDAGGDETEFRKVVVAREILAAS